MVWEDGGEGSSFPKIGRLLPEVLKVRVGRPKKKVFAIHLSLGLG